MPNYKSAESIRADMIAYLDAAGSGIRTEAGEPIVDFIDAVALEGQRINVLAEYLSKGNSVVGWREIVGDENLKLLLADAWDVSYTNLDADFVRSLGVPETVVSSDVEAQIFHDLSLFAKSLGRPRQEATYATGTLTIYLATGDPYTLLKGASVQQYGTALTYETVADLIAVVPSFSQSRNQYFVQVSVRAHRAGRLANAVANTVTKVKTGFTGILSVTNAAAFAGGAEVESNLDLLSALDDLRSGTDINTYNGLRNYILEQTGVQDALIVGPGHPLMTRAGAGAVDIYVLGSVLESESPVIRVLTVQETVTLPFQPVSSVNSATVSGSPLTSGNGYVYNADTTSAYAKSSQARGSITWGEIALGGPSAGTDVTVNMTYNSLIRSLQRLLEDDPDREVPASSILVKEADKIPIYVEVKVVPLPGYSQTSVETAVQTALTDFIDSQRLGDDLDYSDLLVAAAAAEINDTSVVDRIDSFKFGLSADTVGTDNITVDDTEYVRFESITFIAP